MTTTTPTVTEAAELRPLIVDMIEDPRMVGLSRYLASLTLMWSDAIDTACAGHGFIFFNKAFFYKIDPECRITVMRHEVDHLILRHLERSKGLNHQIANQAQDHVINLGLKNDGFIFRDLHELADTRFKGMSSEEVYGVLIAEAKQNPPPPPKPGSGSPSEIEKLVAEACKSAGIDKDEKEIENGKEIDKILPEIGNKTGNTAINLSNNSVNVMIRDASYEEIFEKYMNEAKAKRVRSFMRPSRRKIAGTSLNLPGRISRVKPADRLEHLVYALDVSGSISREDARIFHNSVRTIKELLDPELLTVLYFDTQIKLVKKYTDRQPYEEVAVRAGGGTNLNQVFNYAKKAKTTALIVFTDLCVTIPPKPDYEVIWLVPKQTHKKTPYGKIYLTPKNV